jgi:hypothetical protein
MTGETVGMTVKMVEMTGETVEMTVKTVETARGQSQ